MSVRLYIGNLPKEEVDRLELQAVFAEEGDSVTTKVIKDRKTGKCRGFGFVTVNDDEQADLIIEKYNGQMFKETPLKIEKALPRTKGEEGDEPQSTVPRPVINNASNSNEAAATTGERTPRRSSSKKPRRNEKVTSTSSASTSTDADGVRPDPRWASELEKLKQMLAAQATN